MRMFFAKIDSLLALLGVREPASSAGPWDEMVQEQVLQFPRVTTGPCVPYILILSSAF